MLDPRPDSELIIDITKNLLFDGMRVLDLGCGSGCIGLSMYKENSITLGSIFQLLKFPLTLRIESSF